LDCPSAVSTSGEWSGTVCPQHQTCKKDSTWLIYMAFLKHVAGQWYVVTSLLV
jgi:hypothetical protein